jgi:hypothetical protein
VSAIGNHGNDAKLKTTSRMFTVVGICFMLSIGSLIFHLQSPPPKSLTRLHGSLISQRGNTAMHNPSFSEHFHPYSHAGF